MRTSPSRHPSVEVLEDRQVLSTLGLAPPTLLADTVEPPLTELQGVANQPTAALTEPLSPVETAPELGSDLPVVPSLLSTGNDPLPVLQLPSSSSLDPTVEQIGTAADDLLATASLEQV